MKILIEESVLRQAIATLEFQKTCFSTCADCNRKGEKAITALRTALDAAAQDTQRITELEAVIKSHGIPVKSYSGGVAHYVSGEEWNCQSALEEVRSELAACQKERDKMKEWAVALEQALLESDKAAWEEAIAKAIAEETK